MLELEGINIWAIAVTWLIYGLIGAFWYSPAGFSKKWEKYTGIDILKIPTKQATQILVSVIISSLIQTTTLAIVLNSLDVINAWQGLLIGLAIWFGLTVATTVGVTLYQKLSWKFLILNSSYFLVVMTIGSIILSTWR